MVILNMGNLNINRITAVVFVITVILSLSAFMVKITHVGGYLSKAVFEGAGISTGILMTLILIWLISNVFTFKK